MNKLSSLLSWLSSMSEPAMVIDKSMTIMYQNEAAQNSFGEHAGENCYGVMEGADSACKRCPVPPPFTDGSYRLATAGSKTPRGIKRCAPLFATPIKDEHGAVSECVLFFRDLTGSIELKRQKSDLLSMLSHDLKAPITVIHSYANMLLETNPDIDNNGKEMLEGIKSSTVKYSRLLDDFITLSKAEAGKLALNLKPGSLAELVALCANDMKVIALEKNVTIHTDLPCDLPEVIIDERHCGRVFTNILDNAIKYSAKGGRVWVKAGVEHDGSKNVFIELSDEGPGIPETEISRITDTYYRPEHSRKVQGAGVGLAVVKALTKLHGGSMEITNRAGRGATVKISLPAADHDN